MAVEDVLRVDDSVLMKLENKHNVHIEEVYECFSNSDGRVLKEKNPSHMTDPHLTFWFIGETNSGRLLKVAYIKYPDFYQLKSAYPANKKWIKAFNDLLY